MLLEEILVILNDTNKNSYSSSYYQTWLRVTKIKNKDNSYEISYGAMYEAPAGNLSLARLIRLSELFGTTSIDVDNFAESGCESCDYGSSYGHDIQVYQATKNIEELDKLVIQCAKESGSRLEDLKALVDLEEETKSEY